MYSLIAFTAPMRRLTRRCVFTLLAGGYLWLALVGAPHSAQAQTFVAEWGMDDIGRPGPTGLAIDTVGSSSFLYIADQRYGRIIKVNLATGARAGVWGQTGVGPLEFNNPYGVAVDPVSHDLYIAERTNQRVQRITNTGTFVMGWGELGSDPGKFDNPIGIAADAHGNVYVVDHNNARVQKFHVQQNGSAWDVQVVTTWGGLGSGPGKFNAPYGMALDSKGNVWVADGGNHRIQKFDANGNFLAAYGSLGTGNGQFITPTWISFDAAGNFYVTESNSDPTNASAPDLANQRVQKFDASGKFVMKWGTYGEGQNQFKLPFQAVVDAQQNAYISDYYNTRVVKYSLTAPPPPPPAGDGSQIVNVSSRLRVTAQHQLIAGFVISGNASKQVLVRGVGPTLSAFGITNPLPNPKLRVYSGTTVVAENEDWSGAAVADAAKRLGAFDLAAGSKDAALLLTLAPGVYSAQVADNGGTGIGLVEVYDADGSATNRVINLATRGFVETGDGVLAAGFVVKGTTAKRLLIRAAGPSLAAFQITDPLANPTLRIVNSTNATVAQNDDWETPQSVSGQPAPATRAEVAAAITATGAFGFSAGARDSAVLVTLQPGVYSAVVSGSGGTTGTALVEVYEVP